MMVGMMNASLRLNASIVLLVLLFASAVARSAPPEPTERERELLKTLQQPDEWFLERLKAPQENVDGQLLHPKIQWYQETFARSGDPEAKRKQRAQQLESMQDPAWRASMRSQVDRTWNYRTKITREMASVEDRKIDGPGGPLAIRIYKPVTKERKPLPGLVYFHGGGWLIGSIEAVDRAVRLLANEAQVAIVSVDYRLAPEHKFPAAQDDALAAFRWVREHASELGIDGDRLGIGGDSAGGGMSAVTSLRLLAAGEPTPKVQLLYYPAVDMRTNTRSYELFGVGYGLDKDFASDVFALFFASEEDRHHPYASPLQARSLRGSPTTIIAAAGFDILRDSEQAFASRLVEEGTTVLYKNYASLNHGFMQHSGTIDDAEHACVETARWFGMLIRGE